MVAICTRKLAEMYCYICLDADVETYGLYDAMQQLPENTWHMWWALSTAQQLGNAGAHARADPLSARQGAQAMGASVAISAAYVARAQAPRARL